MKKNDHESYDVSVWIGWICIILFYIAILAGIFVFVKLYWMECLLGGSICLLLFLLYYFCIFVIPLDIQFYIFLDNIALIHYYFRHCRYNCY